MTVVESSVNERKQNNYFSLDRKSVNSSELRCNGYSMLFSITTSVIVPILLAQFQSILFVSFSMIQFQHCPILSPLVTQLPAEQGAT